MELLLGIDLGTSYFKVGLFDAAGELKGLGRVAVPKTEPAPRRSELTVDDFWRTLRAGLAEALAQAQASAADIVGVSYSSQASTFVLLDRAAQPLTPFVMWTDTRGDPHQPGWDEFAASERFRRTVGFEGLTEFSAASKWRWFQRHDPDRWREAAHLLTISDYFTFALTGEKVGDASTAAFLALYDLNTRTWWPEALEFFGVEPSRLAQPLRPGASVGRTNARATELLGLRSGVPFAVGALDHHAAAIGSGLGTLADLSISTGTVLAALVLVDRPEPRERCYHGLHVDGERFYRLSFDANGAGQLDTYRERHAPQHSIPELLALAAKPAESADGTAVRRILEAACRTHQDLVRLVLPAGKVGTVLATGGGSRSELWLQIDADVLGAPIVTATSPERACLGAAAFAAVAAGMYPTINDAAAAMVRAGMTYEPSGRR